MVKPTAIVVGVGADWGLEAALCRRFAAEGLHVLVAGRAAAKIHPVVRSIVASDQGWLKTGALLTSPPDGAGLCRAWLRERLAGSPAYRARSSAVTVSATASRMPHVTSNQNESPADADRTSDTNSG
jgi:NAD(P)-dependent dehydrogenase (short-subunit alcohol dehydrogenase family)